MTIDPTQLADDMADGTPGLAVELAQQFGRTLDAYRDHELASEALSANQETQIATLTARAEAAEAENAALRADVADLRVRVAELEGALKPFAEQAENFDSDGKEFVPDEFEPAIVGHTIGDLRKARAVLEAKQ